MRNLNLNTSRDLLDVTREIDINLSGPVRMIQQFLPHLKTRRAQSDRQRLVRPGLLSRCRYRRSTARRRRRCTHSLSRCVRSWMAPGISVVELAPPAVETALFRGEFAEEMRREKGMDVKVLVRKAIAGIEAGKLEIRPGLSNVLKIMSRLAPQFMFNQLARLGKPPRAAVATHQRQRLALRSRCR
jgi:uncharacterized oxidoreductase